MTWRRSQSSQGLRSEGASGRRPSVGLNVSCVCRTGMSPRARRLAYLGAFPLGYPEVYMTNSAFANKF